MAGDDISDAAAVESKLQDLRREGARLRVVATRGMQARAGGGLPGLALLLRPIDPWARTLLPVHTGRAAGWAGCTHTPTVPWLHIPLAWLLTRPLAAGSTPPHPPHPLLPFAERGCGDHGHRHCPPGERRIADWRHAGGLPDRHHHL